MNPNLLDILTRKQVLADIKSWENVKRKELSLKAFEVYNDNAYPYVYDKLSCQLSVETANQMPIVSNLNIAKAVVNKEAQVYTDDPKRSYEEITEADAEVLEKLYSDCGFNTYLSKANKYYKLRNQTFLQVVPKYGKLKLRVLHGHNLDVIPDAEDPETAYAYIISSFDKSFYLKAGQDNVNQITADADDYKAKAERYQVWTKEYVFTMDGKGNVVSEILPNAIEELPFIDIAKEKDFEFFVRIGQALTDFTIDFNVAWSDLLYIARLQGYSVGVVSGDPELKPESMTVGPNRFLFLPSNPNNPDSKIELDFKSPNPNIEATLKSIDSLVTTFLSTRGVDSKAVSSSTQGSQNYSSALERLMAMIDQFRASKEDFDLFRVVEKKLHMITTKYLSLLSNTEFLDPEYNVSQGIVNSKINVQFHKPELIETRAESLDNAKKKIDLGIADKVSTLMDVEGLSEDLAIEKIESMEQRKIDMMMKAVGGSDASKSALNGAQVTSLVEIVSKVAAGLLPYDAAQSMIVRSFNVTEDEAKEILGQAGTSFKIDPAQLDSKPTF